jgi:hypothetical protein
MAGREAVELCCNPDDDDMVGDEDDVREYSWMADEYGDFMY